MDTDYEESKLNGVEVALEYLQEGIQVSDEMANIVRKYIQDEIFIKRSFGTRREVLSFWDNVWNYAVYIKKYTEIKSRNWWSFRNYSNQHYAQATIHGLRSWRVYQNSRSCNNINGEYLENKKVTDLGQGL